MFSLLNLKRSGSGRPLIQKNRILLLLLLGCLILFIIWMSQSESLVADDPGKVLGTAAFVVDTAGCKIPDVNPYDSSVEALIHQTERIVCPGKPPLTYVSGETVYVNTTALSAHYPGKLDYCQYEPITRPRAKSDNLYVYNRSVAFRKHVTMTSDFGRFTCFDQSGDLVYVNFHACVRYKPEVERKCKARFEQYKSLEQRNEVYNFLLLGLDSVSRLNYLRHMRKTRQFLLDELQGVELQGYNKVADNTYVNLVPMFAGKFVEELPWSEQFSDYPFDKFRFFWNNASELGYRTLYAEDAPGIAIFNYEKAGFHTPPADYYLRPLSLAMEEHTSMWDKRHHCMGSKLETEFVLDWVADFMANFKSVPHLAFAFLTRLTHEGVNDVGAADEPYLDFFQRLYRQHLLDNTVVLFYSDHGMRFGPIRETYVGKLEERLPFITWILPRSFRKKYPHLLDVLRLNQNRLSTPFDVFETLRSLLKFSGEVEENSLARRGHSLLSEIPPERTCSSAAILSHWCTCHDQKSIDRSNPAVQRAARFVVDYINRQIRKHGAMCAVLELDKITDARVVEKIQNFKRQKWNIHELFSDNFQQTLGRSETSSKEYLVTFQTRPGGAIFESTVERNDLDQYQVVGDISRLNIYGDQSTCIHYHLHKKYCFCL